MFPTMEESDYSIYSGSEWQSYDTDEGAAGQNENDSELEEMECALYAEIHYQQVDNLSENTRYDIQLFSDNAETELRSCGSATEHTENLLEIQRHIKDILSDSRSKKLNKKRTSIKRKKVSVSVDKIKKIKKSKTGFDDLKVCSNVNGSDTDRSSDMDVPFDVVLKSVDNNLKYNVEKDQHGLVSNEVCSNNIGIDTWKIIEEDKPQLKVNKSPFRKPLIRYHQRLFVTCFNCKESGHLSRDCPKPEKYKICIHCGLTGHNWKECSQVICYNCKQIGHFNRECEYPRHYKHTKCSRCSMYGHCKKLCPDNWRQFHMSVSMSLIRCKENLKNPNVWCYNCARKGHFGYQCSRERFDRHSSVTYPFIAKYKNIDLQKINSDFRTEDLSRMENEKLSSKIRSPDTICTYDENWKKMKTLNITSSRKDLKKTKNKQQSSEKHKLKKVSEAKKKEKKKKKKLRKIAEQITLHSEKKKSEIGSEKTEKKAKKKLKKSKKNKNQNDGSKKSTKSIKQKNIVNTLKQKQTLKQLSVCDERGDRHLAVDSRFVETNSMRNKKFIPLECQVLEGNMITKNINSNCQCVQHPCIHRNKKKPLNIPLKTSRRKNIQFKSCIDVSSESDIVDLTVLSSGEDKRSTGKLNGNVTKKEGSLDNPICLSS